MEQWKPVPGQEARYEVSNFGNVRSIARIDAKGSMRRMRYLKPYLTADGYVKVSFFANGRAFHPTVHKLVYQAFHGPIPEDHEINHKDGNRANNAPENLECLTHADNVRYSKDVLRANYATFGNAKLLPAQVLEIRALLSAGGLTQAQIGARFGVTPSVIGNIKTGYSWSHIKPATSHPANSPG